MNNRGQSSVIAAVLLVALVVILSATVGLFTNQVVTESKQAYEPVEVDVTQTAGASQTETQAKIKVTFIQVPQAVSTNRIEVLIDGTPASTLNDLTRADDASGGQFSAGDSIIIEQINGKTLYEGVEVLVRLAGDTDSETYILEELQLSGNDVPFGSFGFSYISYPSYSPNSDRVCASYSGPTLDASKVSIQVYDGSAWVSAGQYYGNSGFDVNNLVSSGSSSISTPSVGSGDQIRVLYDGINGMSVISQTNGLNYNSNC